jgi:hypothetical protein
MSDHTTLPYEHYVKAIEPAGSQILLTALKEPRVTAVTVLSRRELPEWLTSALPSNTKKKLSTVLVPDFTKPPSGLAAHDACIWAMGKSTAGMSEAEYTKLTYDYTMAVAKAIEAENLATPRERPLYFVYLSGEGADRSEKSRVLFARVKGRTENALLALPPTSGIQARVFRPGYFYPSEKVPGWAKTLRPGVASTVMHNTLGTAVKYALPAYYTPVEDLATFLLSLARGEWENEGKDGVLSNKDMRRLLKAFKTTQHTG